MFPDFIDINTSFSDLNLLHNSTIDLQDPKNNSVITNTNNNNISYNNAQSNSVLIVDSSLNDSSVLEELNKSINVLNLKQKFSRVKDNSFKIDRISHRSSTHKPFDEKITKSRLKIFREKLDCYIQNKITNNDEIQYENEFESSISFDSDYVNLDNEKDYHLTQNNYNLIRKSNDIKEGNPVKVRGSTAIKKDLLKVMKGVEIVDG